MGHPIAEEKRLITEVTEIETLRTQRRADKEGKYPTLKRREWGTPIAEEKRLITEVTEIETLRTQRRADKEGKYPTLKGESGAPRLLKRKD